MSEPWEWTESDIRRMVDERVQESLTLDYKSSAAIDPDRRAKDWQFKLSKNVSAFANSAGGALIYGVEEDANIPVRVDGGVDPSRVSRESLEQVIHSSIQRRIPDVRINQIELVGSDRVLYVVHIPSSDLAPHMASDNRYYKRFNFMSVPMEEYEVRDVANRRKTPDLKMEFRLQGGSEVRLEAGSDGVTPKPIMVDLIVSNRAPILVQYRAIRTYTDVRLSSNSSSDVMHLEKGNAEFEVIEAHENQGPPRAMPLWQGAAFICKSWPLRVPALDADGDFGLAATISAPDMPLRTASAMVNVRDGLVSIRDFEEE